MPDLIGADITGTRAAGMTATDIALSLTSFLKENNVISAYLEFYGSGIKYLDLGNRATISNMTTEYGASAAEFAIVNRSID
ncbi:aconitase family protein, partial [Aliarcobacter butzleri]